MTPEPKARGLNRPGDTVLPPDPARLPDGKQESELAGSELLNPPRASDSPKNTCAPVPPQENLLPLV